MQLFGLVNTMLANDRATAERDLSIARYAVIPLSPNSGLIGWVPNTDTLHALIREYRDARKVGVLSSMNGLRNSVEMFILLSRTCGLVDCVCPTSIRYARSSDMSGRQQGEHSLKFARNRELLKSARLLSGQTPTHPASPAGCATPTRCMRSAGGL